MLSALLERASEAPCLSESEAAGVALALADHISQATLALENLKLLLRTQAQKRLVDGETCVTLRGVDPEGRYLGDVTVTFPRPQAVLTKGFSASKMESRLGKAVFDVYFETKVVLRKGALETLRERRKAGGSGEKEFGILVEAVDITEQTARVGFRPIAQGVSDVHVR